MKWEGGGVGIGNSYNRPTPFIYLVKIDININKYDEVRMRISIPKNGPLPTLYDIRLIH